MKIILLNPHREASSELVNQLRARGHLVFHCLGSAEAWQVLKLHVSSVDLAIIHREAAGKAPGLSLLEQIRADKKYSALPAIMTTQEWGAADALKHQSSPNFANAYLRWPVRIDSLAKTINEVFPGKKSTPDLTPLPIEAIPPLVPISPKADGMVLEELTNIFSANKTPTPTSTGIMLEAPDLGNTNTASYKLETNDITSEPVATDPPSDRNADHAFSKAPEAPLPLPFEMPEAPSHIEFTVESSAAESTAESAPMLQIEPPPPKNDAIEIELGEPVAVAEAVAVAGEEAQGEAEILAEPGTQALNTPTPSPEADLEAQQQMPYLFHKAWAGAKNLSPTFVQPVGDSIIPGGAGQTPDVETLKKYLLLREQDVAILSHQLKAVQEQVALAQVVVANERAQSTELSHQLLEQKHKLEEMALEKQLAQSALEKEISEIRFQNKAKLDRARVLELQVRQSSEEIDRLKERVRTDIRKIRVREKELENRLEIIKKDSEALISARDQKVIELKRKVDLLEFNLDLLQDQYTREKETSSKMRRLLAKAAQVVRVAGGLLDSNERPADSASRSDISTLEPELSELQDASDRDVS